MIRSSLKIQELEFEVYLGCQREERKNAQAIRISLDIQFPQTPEACRTDKLDETICYAHLAELIEGFLDKREFQTIEFLAQEVYSRLKEETAFPISVSVWKLRPPLTQKNKGCVFSLSDTHYQFRSN